MRAVSILFFCGFMVLANYAVGQSLRNSGNNRNVLVEHITSANGAFSPDGQYVLDTVIAAYSEVIPVSIHTNDSLTIPAGDSCISAMGAGFTPGFWVDRKKFPASGLTIVRGNLSAFVQTRLQDTLPGQIGIQSYSFDVSTRAVTAEIFAEFSDSATQDFRLNLYIVEDSVRELGPGYDQANYYDTVPSHPFAGKGNPIQGYIHRHLLRKMLGGAWGLNNIIPDTVQSGDFFTHTFQDTLPASIDWEQVSLVAVLQVFAQDSTQRHIWDVKCVRLVCDQAPLADFTASSNGLFANFRDTSTQTPGAWRWDFGDGTLSTLRNPSHLYTSPGTYQVCLIATNACGRDTTCRTVQVTCTQPQAGFSFQNTGNQYSFTDTSAFFPTHWQWDFGDGTTSASATPAHTYSNPGVYTVCLVTSNACGSDSICRTIEISCIPPQASYTFSSGGLTVSFSGGSTLPGVSWFWYFGEGGTSNSQNPTYVYSNPGTYQVCLTISDSCGQNTYCQNVTVGCPLPSSQFSYIYAGLTYEFTDLSANSPISWNWKFGDGTSSFVPNPVHTFPGSGVYETCLITSNPCGNDTSCVIITNLTTQVATQQVPMVKIIPNPANTVCKVAFEAVQEGDFYQLTDITGKIFWREEIASGALENRFSTQNYPSGLYFLSGLAGGLPFQKRLVIQH